MNGKCQHRLWPGRQARTLLTLLGLLLSSALPAAAGPAVGDGGLDLGGGFGPPSVPVRLELLADRAVAGASVPVAVIYSVPAGTHLTDAFFTVEFASEPPLVFAAPSYPAGSLEGDSRVFRGDVRVTSQVTLPADGPVRLKARAEYQICQEGEVEMCFAPAEANPTLMLELAAAGTAWAANAAAVAGPSVGLAPATAPAPDGAAREAVVAPAAGGLEGRLERALASGSWLAFLLVFLGGVLTSFTPCVYPMIPITISYIGGSATRPSPARLRAVALVRARHRHHLLRPRRRRGGHRRRLRPGDAEPPGRGVVAAHRGAMGPRMAGLFDLQLPSALHEQGGRRAHGGFLGPS